MAQDKIKFNDTVIFQPDKGLGYDFETTYTEDSGRVQTGTDKSSPLFTVEAYNYTASNIPAKEVAKILNIVIRGHKFKMHYFSPLTAAWKDGYFRIAKGSMSIGSLKNEEEEYESLSFNIVGVNPI